MAITPAEFEALFQSHYPLVCRRLYYLLGERAAAAVRTFNRRDI